MVVSPSTEAKAEVTQTTEVSSWWEDLENQKTNIKNKYKTTAEQDVRIQDVFDTLSFAGVRTKVEIESIVKNVIKLTSATDWEVFTATLEKITAECVDVMLGNMKKPIVYTEAQISDRINNRTGVVASVEVNDATKLAKQAEIITPLPAPVDPEAWEMRTIQIVITRSSRAGWESARWTSI